MNIQQYGSTVLTLLTAHFGISLLHNCTEIQYLLYSNCSKCPPPVAKHFSSGGRLVPDVVPFDHGKDINLLHVKFATPAYVIRRCERPFYEWTDVDFSEPSQECSLHVLIVRTTSLSDRTATLRRQPVSRNV